MYYGVAISTLYGIGYLLPKAKIRRQRGSVVVAMSWAVETNTPLPDTVVARQSASDVSIIEMAVAVGACT